MTTKKINKNMIVNAIKNNEDKKISFLVKENGNIKEQDKVVFDGEEITPLSYNSGAVKKDIVKFPERVEEFKSKEKLVQEIKDFIHDYVDVSEEFEAVSANYVLMSWVYEDFENLPYMRVRGKPGNGKSRYLNVMSELVFYPMVFKGDQTESVLFRTIDKIQGTLILDEADFRFSDRTNGLIKMLNNGFEQGGIISRNKVSDKDDFEPSFFEVYGPKILANIRIFKDDALESRCITEVLEKIDVREEVLVNLNDNFKERALNLRNKLLKFRFDNIGKIEAIDSKDIPFEISTRGKQIASCLYTLMNDKDKKHLETLMMLGEDTLESIRDNSLDVDVIKVIAKAYFEKKDKVELKEIVYELEKDNEGFNKITSKSLGSILTNLNIKKKRAGASGNTSMSISDNLMRIKYWIKYHNIKKEDVMEGIGEWGDELTEDTEATEGELKAEDINPFEKKEEFAW